MYFILNRRISGKPKHYLENLGLVVAESADDAVAKIRLIETDRHEDGHGTVVFLVDDKGAEYLLDSIEEITTLLK